MHPLAFLALGTVPVLILVRGPHFHSARTAYLDYAAEHLLRKAKKPARGKADPELVKLSNAIKDLRKTYKDGWKSPADRDNLLYVTGKLVVARTVAGANAVDQSIINFLDDLEKTLNKATKAPGSKTSGQTASRTAA